MVKVNSSVTSGGHPVPLCGWAGAVRFSLPENVTLPQTDRPLCGWRKGKALHSLFSHSIPLLNLLWERKKHLNRWLSDTSSQVARQRVAGCCLCSVWAARKKVRVIRKNLGGCVSSALTDKNFAEVWKISNKLLPKTVWGLLPVEMDLNTLK